MTSAIKKYIPKNNNWIKRFFPTKKRVINVIFRYDDFSALSRTDLELSILEICKQNNFRFTFAVVPFIVEGDVHLPGDRKSVPLSIEKIDILKNAVGQGLIDIALHGFSHQSNRYSEFSEFVGLDYQLQLTKISAGKKNLEEALNARVDIFAPPWNSYDDNTLAAIQKLKFSTLTAGRNGAVSKTTQVKIIPSTCSLKRLPTAIQQARTGTVDHRPIIVVLFHEFEFLDIDPQRGLISFQEFSNLISWLRSQEDIRILSIGQAAKAIKGLGAKKFLSMKKPSSAFYQ
jgi:peptidoglycan/xylan/chitin deacetylase (PgdA/CDA1 family)